MIQAEEAANISHIFNDIAQARLNDPSLSWDSIFATDDILDLDDPRYLFVRLKMSAEAHGPANVIHELDALAARQQKYGMAPPDEVIPVTKPAPVRFSSS